MLSTTLLAVVLLTPAAPPEPTVPVGCKSVTITLPARSFVGSFPILGSRVDAILVKEIAGGGTDEIIVAEDLLVLALDTCKGETYTLAVKPNKVEAVKKAAATQNLYLCLRPIGD